MWELAAALYADNIVYHYTHEDQTMKYVNFTPYNPRPSCVPRPRYSFITKKSGKKANIKHVSNRQDAREIKAARGFKVDIYDHWRGEVIR